MSGKTGNGPFERLGLDSRVCEAVKRLGFNLPTPIQRKVIPAILKDDGDVVANARTGSGKTAAFLLPMIQLLQNHSTTVGARGLIISPTRELTMQTAFLLHKLIKNAHDFRLCFLTGGSNMEKELEHLALNPDIIVATPGRLVHHLRETNYGLGRIELAVFDEADLLFEMGFEAEINLVIKACTLHTRRFILLSATLPTRLVDFASIALVNPKFIQLDTEHKLNENLSLDFFILRQEDKVATLLFILQNVLSADEQAIIFCSTSHHVNFLSEILNLFKLPHCTISGALDQEERSESIAAFKSRTTKLLIASDVAARGIDITKLDYVINFSFPASPKLFIHRSGRTARKDETGKCISLLERDEIPYFVELCLFCGIKLPVGKPSANNIESARELGLEINTNAFNLTTIDNRVKLGGMPIDLTAQYNDMLLNIYGQNSTVQRLYKSMVAGEKQYMRFRQPASKMSMTRSYAVQEAFGGLAGLQSLVHPLVSDFVHATSFSAITNDRATEASLVAIFGETIKTKPEQKEDLSHVAHDFVDKESLQNFKLNTRLSQSKGNALSRSIHLKLHANQTNAAAVTELASKGLGSLGKETVKIPSLIKKIDEVVFKSKIKSTYNSAISTSDVDIDTRQRSRARTPRKSPRASGSIRVAELEKTTNFVLNNEMRDDNTIARQIGLSLNGMKEMRKSTLTLLGDTESELRKSGNTVMKWNAKKKKYELTKVDGAGQRMKEPKVDTAQQGKLRSIIKSSRIRIQRTGEQESADVARRITQRRESRRSEHSMDDSEELPAPDISSMTRNLGLVEKVKTGCKLTHKEERIYSRLRKNMKNPITIGGKGDKLKNLAAVAKSARKQR